MKNPNKFIIDDEITIAINAIADFIVIELAVRAIKAIIDRNMEIREEIKNFSNKNGINEEFTKNAEKLAAQTLISVNLAIAALPSEEEREREK